MVLAVAALLLQFQSFAPPAQTVGAQMPVIQAASCICQLFQGERPGEHTSARPG